MKKMCFLTMLSVFIFAYSNTQDLELDKLLKDFQSNEWSIVSNAKENLENLEKKSIPGLMEMLKDNSNRKLINTGDLIYPGAERFYGHGQIINYDIDKIDIRAGWLLEELTFRNFGFTGVHIDSSGLVDYIKFNFPNYYNNSINRQLIEKSTESALRDLIKNQSIQEAEKWWSGQGGNWNRFKALSEALKSSDEKRQAKALFYLRNGKTKCTGLTKTNYKSKLENDIKDLSKSPLKRISEQAKLIMLDSQFEWLKQKASSNK